MDRVHNLQMSLFGSFINIKPKTDIIIKLLLALQEDEFIPGSADVASVDFTTGKMMVDSRMQLISQNRTWTIVFLPERIDFNYNYQVGTEVYRNIEPLLAYAQELVRKVFSAFSSTTGNRLALSCKMALEDMTAGDLKQFCMRFSNPLRVYNGDKFADWCVRFNEREDIAVAEDLKESCNRIMEMVQVEKQDIDNQGTDANHNIILSIDINTVANNQEYRFTYDNLLYFSNEAKHFIVEIVKEISGE